MSRRFLLREVSWLLGFDSALFIESSVSVFCGMESSTGVVMVTESSMAESVVASDSVDELVLAVVHVCEGIDVHKHTLE